MTYIPARAASRLLDSVAFLNAHYGQLLNGHITLNFEQLGVPDVQAAKQALTDLNEHLARRIRSATRPLGSMGDLYYVYAHERSREHGWHVHELIAAPRVLLRSIKPWLRSWVAGRYGTDAVSRRSIEFSYTGGRNDQVQERLQAKLVRYILKTVAPANGTDRSGEPAPVQELVGIKRQQASGPLPIRRLAGVSQNLGIRAQLAAGYSPPKHWEDLLSIGNLWEYRDRRPPSAELTEQLLELPDVLSPYFHHYR